MSGVLDIIVGGLLTIATTIGVEYSRRPSLSLEIEKPPCDILNRRDGPARDARHLRLVLRNNPLPAFLRWMLRGAALQCRGEVTFHHLDGQDVFGRKMPVRWANSPQPVANQITDLQGEVQFLVQDRTRNATESRMDVYPGESEILDVAARFDDDTDCYGWNNDAYFFEWRNPYWRLPAGRFLVKVVITSSGQKCVGKFRMVNDVSRSDFRLEQTNAEDKAKFR